MVAVLLGRDLQKNENEPITVAVFRRSVIQFCLCHSHTDDLKTEINTKKA